MPPTPTYRLAKHLLGEDPRTYVETERAAGKTFRAIAREMWLKTDGEIDVSETTIMGWVKNGAA